MIIDEARCELSYFDFFCDSSHSKELTISVKLNARHNAASVGLVSVVERGDLTPTRKPRKLLQCISKFFIRPLPLSPTFLSLRTAGVNYNKGMVDIPSSPSHPQPTLYTGNTTTEVIIQQLLKVSMNSEFSSGDFFLIYQKAFIPRLK